MKRALLIGMLIALGGCHAQKTYSEGCGPPPETWITPRDGRSVLSILYLVTIDADSAIQWSGTPVSEAKFRRFLGIARDLNPAPVIQIKFASKTSCATVIRFRKAMTDSLDCKSARCAEGGGRWWMVGDVGPPFEAYDPHPELPQHIEQP